MKRVRTVEHEKGWGWIARDPATGREIIENFRWASSDAARTAVMEARMFKDAEPYYPPPSQGEATSDV
jgi:hypothetical protein